MSTELMSATRQLEGPLLQRFLRYVRVDTQSARDADVVPSTPGQLDLARMLEVELSELGLHDVQTDENGCVWATVPASDGEDAPPIGLLAHLDTALEESGANVTPIVHQRYDGSVIALPGDPGVVLDPEQMPELFTCRGHDLVTADGTTLLGADDKAGIAAIVTCAEHLMARQELRHGELRLVFTPDEEVGAGVAAMDLERLPVAAAYTIDGAGLGELDHENFSAARMSVAIRGVSAHTGLAKGEMVSALKVACELVRTIAEQGPEYSADREGFIHVASLEGEVAHAAIDLYLREFDEADLDRSCLLVERLAAAVEQRNPGCTVNTVTQEQYSNMKPVLDRHPHVVAAADAAMRRIGIAPVYNVIRGGTDGAVLSARGIPTPNLFSGAHAIHSRYEWASVTEMAAAAAVMVELAQVWAERHRPK